MYRIRVNNLQVLQIMYILAREEKIMKAKENTLKNGLKQDIKKIVALAKSKDLVRSYKEAFVKYPVENEQHKGKLQTSQTK